MCYTASAEALTDLMQKLLDFLNRLDRERIAYTMEHNWEDAVMVLVTVPGERWEVEFFADGTTEIEVFTSQGVADGAGQIEELFSRYRDEPAV